MRIALRSRPALGEAGLDTVSEGDRSDLLQQRDSMCSRTALSGPCRCIINPAPIALSDTFNKKSGGEDVVMKMQFFWTVALLFVFSALVGVVRRQTF